MNDNEQNPESGCDEPRRDVLKGIGAAIAVSLAGLTPQAVSPATQAPDTTSAAAAPRKKYPARYQWTVFDTKGTREFPGWRGGAPEIWAYTERMSYTAGERVDLRVHTTGRTFAVRVDRDGYPAKTVLQKDGIRGTRQKTPEDAAIRGCGWSPSFSVDTSGWTPGVYVVQLSTRDESGREASGEHLFVLQGKQPGATSKMCLVLATSTYTAYNDWGGANHYRSIREGMSTDVLEPVLSTQRPWGRGFVLLPQGAPDVVVPETPGPFWKPDYPQVRWALENERSRHYPDAGWATYERRFVQWAESNGYALEFATQHDLHQRPELFDRYKCLVFVGHDEYWSWEMRDTVDRFVDAGGRAARFGGNFWCQVRLENEGRSQVCYKDSRQDPLATTARKARSAIGWDDPIVNRPSVTTFGLRASGYSRYGATTPRSTGGFTVYRPWHWAFAGTDLYYGDDFGRSPVIVHGFETDGLDYEIANGLPRPAASEPVPENFRILALAPSVSGEPDRWNGKVLLNAPLDYGLDPQAPAEEGAASPAVEPGAESVGRMSAGMVVAFDRGQGSVFNAGSCTWVRGLEMNDFYTAQITKNVLNRFSG